MTQTWIVLLVTIGIVLIVDVVTTHLRRRARRTSNLLEPSPTETELEDQIDEGVALDHD